METTLSLMAEGLRRGKENGKYGIYRLRRRVKEAFVNTE